jgi:hypothetical protein
MRRRRLTKRTLLTIVAYCGVLLAWARAQGPLFQPWAWAAHSCIAWGLCFAAAFGLARTFGPTVRGGGLRISIAILFALTMATALYAAWSHDRAWNIPTLNPDLGFPFPDRPIIRFANWIDVRRPAAPGSLKLHGEFPAVAVILGTLVLVLLGAAGTLSGLLTNRPDDPAPSTVERPAAR